MNRFQVHYQRLKSKQKMTTKTHINQTEVDWNGMECKSNDNSGVSSNVYTRTNRHISSEIDTNQCSSVKLPGASENEPIRIYECPV